MAAAAGRTLRVALVANTTNFRKGMMSAVRDAQGFQGKMTALGASLSRFAGPMLAGAAAAAGAFAIKLGVDGVKAAIDEQAALSRLGVALDNVGQGFASASVNKFIDDLQFATGVADDELRPAFIRLVTATKDVAEAQKLLGLALDISAQGYGSVESVSTALSKAALGQTTALRRLGVPLDAAILKSGDLAAITAELSKQFGGAAEAAANTFAGKMKILNIAANELQEAFGTGVINAMQNTGESITDLADRMRALQDEAQTLGETVGNQINTFIDVVQFLGAAKDQLDQFTASSSGAATVVGALSDSLNRMINPLGWAVDHVKVLAAWVSGNDQALGEALGAVKSAADQAAPAVATFGDAAAQTAEEVAAVNEELSAFDVYLNKTQAILDYEAAWDALKKSIRENGKAFDYNSKAGRANNDALITFAQSTADAAAAQETMFGKVSYVQSALGDLSRLFDNTKMSDSTRAAMLKPFQDLIDSLDITGSDLINLQTLLDSLKSKTITVTTQYVTLGDGTYFGSGDAAGGAGADSGGGGGGKKTGTSTRSAAVTIGTLNVTSAPGERAEDSVPRSLRRLAFVAGLNG